MFRFQRGMIAQKAFGVSSESIFNVAIQGEFQKGQSLLPFDVWIGIIGAKHFPYSSEPSIGKDLIRCGSSARLNLEHSRNQLAHLCNLPCCEFLPFGIVKIDLL